MDLTKITTPFGLLDAETQQALQDCDGPLQYYGMHGWADVMHYCLNPWSVYRQKPQPLTQDTIPWAQIDKRFKWAARDEYSGKANAYEMQPDVEEATGQWVIEGGDWASLDAFADYRPGTCDWRDSLQQRPETD